MAVVNSFSARLLVSWMNTYDRSKASVAAALGCSEEKVRKMTHGDATPTAQELLTLAELSSISMERWMGGKP